MIAEFQQTDTKRSIILGIEHDANLKRRDPGRLNPHRLTYQSATETSKKITHENNTLNKDYLRIQLPGNETNCPKIKQISPKIRTHLLPESVYFS